MKTCLTASALLLMFALNAFAETPISKRDQAIQRIDACLREDKQSFKACRKTNEDIETLVGLYRQGDKSVLPTLFHFTHLTAFYGDALLANPEAFLSSLSQLSKEEQGAVTEGIAGGMFGLKAARFQALRAVLMAVPETSSARETARLCRDRLERNNAVYLIEYFPANTFTRSIEDFQLHWYSNALYSLSEKPLLPAVPRDTVFRLTVLPSFVGPKSVTLAVLPDGQAQVRMKSIAKLGGDSFSDTSRVVTVTELALFLEEFNQLHFWDMPAEAVPRQSGLDGTEYILETIQNGRYHVAVRWCPAKTPFGDSVIALLQLAGSNPPAIC